MTIPARSQIKLDEVVGALGHPVRLAIIAALADDDQHRCGSLVIGVSKSTLTHHWRVLRDAGLIYQEPSGRENLLSLRRNDLDHRFPGLLPSILTALATDRTTRAAIAPYFAKIPSISA